MQNPPTSEYVSGALYGFAAVCIWAAFIVVSRLEHEPYAMGCGRHPIYGRGRALVPVCHP
jgi:hypothetical protein